MKMSFSSVSLRFLFVALLGTAGLATTSCDDDPKAVPSQDFSAIDEAIIKKYLTDYSITTAQRQTSGLYYQPIVTNPTGVQAAAKKTVSVLYTGRFMDGRIFDASSQHNNVPISFVLGAGQVIPGWDEGIALMRKGEKAQLFIPSALAYGSAGAPPSIPANTVLRFDVELVDVK